MGKIVRMKNGNIGYIVKEDNYLDVTLNFSINKIDLDGKILDKSTVDSHFDIDAALMDYLNGKTGLDEDTAITNFMETIVQKSEEWMKRHGLKGSVIENMAVKPNEWIDGFIIYSTLRFDKDDLLSNNYAKVKSMKVYDEIRKMEGTGPLMYSIDIELKLSTKG